MRTLKNNSLLFYCGFDLPYSFVPSQVIREKLLPARSLVGLKQPIRDDIRIKMFASKIVM